MPTALLKMTAVPVTSPYGWRILKKSGIRNFHKGADTANGAKYAHSAFGAGRVKFAGRRPYGHPDYERGIHVIIEHAEGIDTSHHSLSKLNVKTGDVVEMGDIIGWAGESAVGAKGAHVHNALWLDGQHVDPLEYLTPGVAVTVSLRELAPIVVAPLPAGEPTGIPTAPLPTEPEELDMSTIRYVHRDEIGYSPEWMIVGMEVPGGFQTTTDKTTAEGWGAIYGTDKGDSWKALSRKQYIALQASAKSLNAKYVAQQKQIHG